MEEMEIYKITDKNLIKLVPLFEGWEETMIRSVLQGEMGSAWADSAVHPSSAMLFIADFCFFAGAPCRELAARWMEEKGHFTVMVPQNGQWSSVIRQVYKDAAKPIVRYALKKEYDIFDREKLMKMSRILPAGYEIRMIDERIYHMAGKEEWSSDLCSQFPTFADYRERGIGTAVLFDGTLAAGASSYTVYQGGIEIEIDTKEEHRRRGLARACAARLILECLDRGLYPAWDAHNKASLALALKLGYHFDKEYEAFEICKQDS